MSATPESNLPKPFTSLIGRDTDIVTVTSLLEESSGSILTLVGPAGVEKTRLAIEVAREFTGRFDDSVVYVDLSAVTDHLLVIPALIRAVGIPDGEGGAGRLARHLSGRALLLVIDNFEQVRDAAPVLNSCLAGAPGVRTLVTSQAPLRVWGERVYAVAPLALPDAQSTKQLTNDAIRQFEANPAVGLFVRRAQLVRPAFALTTANAAAVVEICRQLDGLPLAIELAAARSNVLSPEALLVRLSAPLGLLSGGPRDAPDRHRALQSAISWSYELLPRDEAVLFERLSIFAGSFSLGAVEAVAGNGPIVFRPSFYVEPANTPPVEPQLDAAMVLDLLDALVDHSLVQRIERDDGEPRFRLFTTIRQFAAERLRARGGAVATATRHATWFHAQAEATWMPEGVPQLEWEWLEPLARDDENLRAALDHVSETDPPMAATFASVLCWYYYFNGFRLDGVRSMERIDGHYDPALLPAVVRARIDYAFGILLVQLPSRKQDGVKRFESMLATVESIDLDWAAGFAMLSLGIVAEDFGEYERSIELCRGARKRLAPLPDPSILPNVDVHIATSLFGLGQHEAARELAIPIAEAPHDQVGPNVVYALSLLGLIALVERNYVDAARRMLAYLDLCLAYHLTGIVTEVVDATATLTAHMELSELSARLFGAADRLNAETGNPSTFPERTVYEAARERIQIALGGERFLELYRAGAQLSLEPALALARQTLMSISAENGTISSLFETDADQRAASLTRRELDVLAQIARGLTDRQIGDELFISHRTVRTHVGHILEKLDVPSRSAATSFALREGLVTLDD